MGDEWYCEIAGREIGPLSSEQLRAMAAKAQILPSDCVRQGGQGPWILARQVKGLFPPPADSAGVATSSRVAPPSSSAPRAKVPPSQLQGVSQGRESPGPGRSKRKPVVSHTASAESLPVAPRLSSASPKPLSPPLQAPAVAPPAVPPTTVEVFDPVALGIIDDPADVKEEVPVHARAARARERRRLEQQKILVGVLAATVVVVAISGLLLSIGGGVTSEPGHNASAPSTKNTPPPKPAASPEALEAREGIDVLDSPKSKPTKIATEAEKKPTAADFDHPKAVAPSDSSKALSSK